MHLRRSVCLVTVVATAALTLGASTASSRPGQQASKPASNKATLAVSYKIRKFVRQGSRLYAYGTTVGRYVRPGGATAATTRKPFKAPVTVLRARGLSQGQGLCPVLDLTLGPVDLNLLGLIAHLDTVHLTLNADPNGGTLGKLFCDLVNKGKLTPQVQKLNWAMTKSGLQNGGVGVSVSVPTAASGALSGSANSRATSALAPQTICPVLELTAGPLDVDLLGLLVHLDTIHLVITADSNGGVLGAALCSALG